MRKGVTPVIAIIILLFITIALAGAAWTYLQGFLLGYTGKSFQVPLEGIYCSNDTIRVYVTNTGTLELTETDFIITEIDGQEVTPESLSLAPPSPPTPGESGKLIDKGGYSVDAHTVRIGTGTTVVTRTVYCTGS